MANPQSTALRECQVGAETAIVISEALVLIHSKSEAGTWHAVEILNGQPHCTCKGFEHRGSCRHLQTASVAVTAELGIPSGGDADRDYPAWLDQHAYGVESQGVVAVQS